MEKELIPPVKQGDIINLEIINVGKQGDGIGRYDGFVIIVPKTKSGETVEVEITKVMPRLAFAELVKPAED